MPYYPAKEIKAKLDILEIFKKDGHVMQRSGSQYFCLCPFHEEKTPSCCVSPEKQMFHCFGCNIGGDLIQYWQHSRKCSFLEALPSLASIAGIAAEPASYQPVKNLPRKLPRPPEKPSPLANKDLRAWAKACNQLINSPAEINRIATWRHFSEALVLWAAEQQLLGIYSYAGTNREAFIVKAPDITPPHLISTSIHIRLAAKSSCNPTSKSSWRFFPTGQKSWPFIIGSTHSARVICITEGPWDALALCEVMQWHRRPKIFEQVCVVGLRGSSSGTLLLRHPLNPQATVLAFPDSDSAGDHWFAEDGLLDNISTQVKTVYAYSLDKRNSDLNQRLQEGLTKDQLLASTPVLSPSQEFSEVPGSLKQILLQSLK